MNDDTLILTRPHVTEKSAMKTDADHPVYTFVIPQTANKLSVARAVKTQYKVTPVRVNVVRIPAKQVIVRGKRGTKAGYKKAIVYLKKGDTIAFA